MVLKQQFIVPPTQMFQAKADLILSLNFVIIRSIFKFDIFFKTPLFIYRSNCKVTEAYYKNPIDRDSTEKLWNISEELVGLGEPKKAEE